MLDKKLILTTIAGQLESLGFGNHDALLQDLGGMNEIITSCKTFPWHSVAAQLEMDRWRLYHWYFETFQRMLLGGVKRQDQALIKQLIKLALLKNEPLTKQFQTQIKGQLSQFYHRSSFSIAFNNQKRQAMKELQKEDRLPQDQNYQRRVPEVTEIQRFIQSNQSEIKRQKEQVSFASGSVPPSPVRFDTNLLQAFVPVITPNVGKSAHQQIKDFLDEPSTTTADFCQALLGKIGNYNTALESQKLETEDNPLETHRIDILMTELKRLQDEVTELEHKTELALE